MKRKFTTSLLLLMIILVLNSFTACTPKEERRPEERDSIPMEEERAKEEVKKPPIPEQLKGDRSVVVYFVDEKAKKEIDIEEYIAGVLAGEMKNDWPEEALKAQAILARTFATEFLTSDTSKYEGADLSTDIKEAQAWNKKEVNERINKAVEETSGMVAVSGGKYIKAWFHSHGGGQTALAKEGLEYKDNDTPYVKSVKSLDSKDAPPEDAQWTAEFSKGQIIEAAKKMGKNLKGVSKIEVGEKGDSGRALVLNIDGTAVSAPGLRIALDSTKMKSTLLTNIEVRGDKVVFKGKGYGHGVGMPQWGAYAMAKDGKKASEIVKYYFKDVEIVKLWD